MAEYDISNYPGDTYPCEPIWIPWNDITLSVCRSGLRGPLAYSLLGGGIPTQSIG